MKKALFILPLLAILTSMNAQRIDLSLKGTYGSTWLFNKNVSDKGDVQDYAAGWGYSYGAGFGYFFSDRFGFEIEYLLNTHNGNYTGVIDSNTYYDSKVTIKSSNIPVLFKLETENGGYLEVGPSLWMVSKADYDATWSMSDPSSGNTISADTNYSVKKQYAGINLGAVLGFGIKVKFGKHLSLKTGLRLEYGFADLKGVDAVGTDFRNTLFYSNPETTNSASASLLVGLTWSIGNVSND
jgi:hypothetical protein